MVTLWWLVLRKIIRLAKDNRLTSLVDFIGSRYGKSAALADLVTVIAVVLEKLSAMGVKLLMDDFGTGYSSLSYLYRFPLNTLKINASFVRRMDVDRKNADIIQSISTLAHTLYMDIVAEGVENATQLAQLRALQVEYGQGYFFAQPLDTQAAEAMLIERPHW